MQCSSKNPTNVNNHFSVTEHMCLIRVHSTEYIHISIFHIDIQIEFVIIRRN